MAKLADDRDDLIGVVIDIAHPRVLSPGGGVCAAKTGCGASVKAMVPTSERVTSLCQMAPSRARGGFWSPLGDHQLGGGW
jgi:hypothetical protein